MKLNFMTAALLLAATATAYTRLPDLTVELRRGWAPWQVNAMLTSAMLGIGVMFGLVCVAVLICNWLLYERPANRAIRAARCGREGANHV